MATPGTVTKIYDLKSLGYADLSKQLDNIAKKFDTIKKAKLSAQGKMSLAQDAVEVKKYSDEMEQLILKEQELRVETQRLASEIKAEQLIRQQQINTQRQRVNLNDAEAGSIARIRADIAELNKLTIQRNKTSGSTIDFRGEILSYDQAIEKLKQLIAAEQEFRRQFQKDGTLVAEYTTGIVQAFKRMGLDDLVAGQITRSQQHLKDLNADFDRLQEELKQTKAAGQSTESIEKQMVENRNEVIKLDTELSRLRNDLRGVGNVGDQVSSSITNGFKSLKGQAAQFALSYVGIQQLINKTQEGVQTARVASDQTTDLEIQLNNDAKAAERLNKSLAALDTRTTLAGLQKIADVALKAGASAEEIEGITAAIDKAKVAFGNDFGSIEEGTETISKLINIFFEGQITGERILQISNSIRALANETVASVPFLTDFSGRMAGVRQISNITLPDIIGLGAGFEEFKQSAETASTVLVKVIPKLAEDTEKYGKIAGLTREQFSLLLNSNPAEALLKVSEGLVKSGRGIEDISKALSDSDLGSGRITTILATLGGKADIFRERIARAGATMQETTAIEDAFEKKNNNLAASIDKINKKFSDAFASKQFQFILGGIVSVVTLLIAHLPTLLVLLGLLTVSWVAQNAALLSLRAQLIFYNLAIGANLLLINTLRFANIAYTSVLWLFNGALKGVTVAMRFFGIATTSAAGPLGVLIALLGLLASALAGLSGAFARASDSLLQQNAAMRAANEVQKESAKIYTSQIAEIDSWIKVIKSSVTSIDTKKRAVEELTKINKLFGDVIKDNVVDLEALDKAYQKVTSAIITQANAQASAELTAKKQQRLVAITALRQQIEIGTARGGDVSILTNDPGVSALEKEILLNLKNASSTRQLFSPGDKLIGITQKNVAEVLKELRNLEDAAAKEFQTYLEVKNKYDADLQALLKEGTIETKGFEVDIASLKAQIEKLDKEISEFKGSRADLTKKVAERKKLQDELDKLLGQNQKTGGTGRGSRLTGDQKDDFKDIDALRDEQLARLNKSFLDQTQFIRRERQMLKQGEDGKLSVIKESQNVFIRDEEAFLREQLEINQNAIDQKLKLLKGANAEERKQIADLRLERIRQENDTNEKIFEIRSKTLRDQLDITIRNAQEAANRVKNDPNVNVKETDRVQAQLDADRQILAAQLLFNQQMDALEKDRNDVSTKNAEDRARGLSETQGRITQQEKDLILANIVDIRRVGEKLMAEFELMIDKSILLIQADTTLTQAQKQSRIRILENEREFGLLARQKAMYQDLAAEFKKAYDAGVVTLAQYEENVKKLQELQGKLAERPEKQGKGFFDGFKIGFGESIISALQRAARDFGSKIFKDPKMGEEFGAAFANAIQESYQLAGEAMNGFFDAEQERIRQSLDLQLERIEIEKKQVQARAQSQAEIESLEKQYEAKKRAAEKEAGEKLKKAKRSEAKLALATELAGIAASAALNPANGPTFGVAGAIMYAALAGVAFARYAIRVNEINREQFEFGGMPSETGGKITGPSHAQGGVPFNYEAQGGELAIVNKRSAHDKRVRTITGTNMQIASMVNQLGGGVNFASGAKLHSFASGGYLGDNLQPPIFTPRSASIDTGDTNKLLSAIKEQNELVKQQNALVERLAVETSNRIDRLEVVQVTNTVTKAQEKAVKQNNVGEF